MPKKITPTSGQKRGFVIHIIAFAIAVIVMVLIHRKQGENHWAYPWHAWIIAAWSLALIGHFSAVFRNYADRGMDKYRAESRNS